MRSTSGRMARARRLRSVKPPGSIAPSARVDRSRPQPEASYRLLVLAIVVYFACYFLFWAVDALVFHEMPHGDDIEQLLQAAHPALGYSKQPPLPSLVLFAVEQLVPASIALVYWMGAACVAMTILFAWKVGNATLGAQRAWAGVLAITCITFYTERLHLYNNNTAILVAYAAAMLCVWRAVMSNRKSWWVALGVAWGAGMLGKYQMALPILCNGAFVAGSNHVSLRSRIAGLSVAGVVAAILFAPHVLWLFQNHFPTFSYASTELLAHIPAAGRPNNILSFFADEVWRTVPAILLLRTMYVAKETKPPSEAGAATDARVHRFWLIHAWGPMAMMFLLAALGGTALQMHWGTAFLWTMPFWFLSTKLGGRLRSLSFARALGCAASVQAVLILFKMIWPKY